MGQTPARRFSFKCCNCSGNKLQPTNFESTATVSLDSFAFGPVNEKQVCLLFFEDPTEKPRAQPPVFQAFLCTFTNCKKKKMPSLKQSNGQFCSMQNEKLPSTLAKFIDAPALLVPATKPVWRVWTLDKTRATGTCLFF